MESPRTQVSRSNFMIIRTSKYFKTITEILDLIFSSDSKSIVIITPDPMTRDKISEKVDNHIPIYNHLQWDVVEDATSYDYIIAINPIYFNKREKELLFSKARRFLFVIGKID